MACPFVSFYVLVFILWCVLFGNAGSCNHWQDSKSILKINWKPYSAFPSVNIPVHENRRGRQHVFLPVLSLARQYLLFPVLLALKK